MIISAGEVWLAYFQFDDDRTKGKVRPVIVLDTTDVVRILCMKVTTHPPRDEYDHQITEWVKANLRKPSTARASKVLNIEKRYFQHKIGKLEDKDFNIAVNLFIKFVQDHKETN